MTSPDANGWMPIETAPKNAAGNLSGPAILVWCKRDHVVRQVQWTMPVDVVLRHLIWVDVLGKSVANQQPTHWMPLPSPPVQP